MTLIVIFLNIYFLDPGQKKDKLTKNVISWLPNEVLKHNSKVIPSLSSKKMFHPSQSNVDDIKVPHPGLSYNPAIEDHVSLLENIAIKETEFIKQEAHIQRCTQKLFKQVSQDTHEVILYIVF